MSDTQKRILLVAMPWLAALALLLLWEIACIVFAMPEILLPRPSRIAEVMVQRWDILLRFCLETLWTTIIGFAMAIGFGLLLGLAIGASPFVYAGLYPC